MHPSYEVADILQRNIGQINSIVANNWQSRTLYALASCRTQSLGGHIDKCTNPSCNHVYLSYNSFRNRHCPKCQGNKRIVAVCRKLGFHRWTHLNIHQLSQALYSKIRGWINYYGKFHFTEMKRAFLYLNRRLAKWAFNKYKHFKRRKTVYYARVWFRQVAKHYQYLFPHWKYGFTP